jgi:hypothetical protein
MAITGVSSGAAMRCSGLSMVSQRKDLLQRLAERIDRAPTGHGFRGRIEIDDLLLSIGRNDGIGDGRQCDFQWLISMREHLCPACPAGTLSETQAVAPGLTGLKIFFTGS